MTITFKVRQHFGLTSSYKCTAAVAAGNLLTLDANGQVDVAGTASTNVVGVAAETQATVGGQVTVYMGPIECTLLTVGAVTAGATIEPAAGGAIDDTAGTASVIDLGVALEAATAAAWIMCQINTPKYA